MTHPAPLTDAELDELAALTPDGSLHGATDLIVRLATELRAARARDAARQAEGDRHEAALREAYGEDWRRVLLQAVNVAPPTDGGPQP